LQSPDINVNAISNTGVTPLVIAAVKGHHKVVKMLLMDKRVDPNNVGFRGRGAVHGACLHGHIKVLQTLLNDNRVIFNAIDKEGRTPLEDAVRKSRDNIVQLLRSKIQPLNYNNNQLI
jgi:ankyrin repeat protein